MRSPVDYLRISVTDRCNFRCGYCMPPEGVPLKRHDEILSYEEIISFTRATAGLGISRVRITGGEPLVRRRCVDLVAGLAAVDGVDDLSMTTNGSLLAAHAAALKQAGLGRVNISIDSFHPGRFGKITGGAALEPCLAGIDAALSAGLAPVKLNAVMLPGIEAELEAFVELVRELPLHVRFIELMPFDGRGSEASRGCGPDGLPAGEGHGAAGDGVNGARLLELLGELVHLEPLAAPRAPAGGGPACYYGFNGARGSLGMISRADHFCSRCNRLRLTADGRLWGCLFSGEETDIRPLIAEGGGALATAISRTINSKLYDWRRCSPGGERRAMAQIGG